MFDIDKWQEIFQVINKNKLRTFLTAFSVAWGIFMLIMLLGFGNGLQNGAEYTFRDDAVNSLWIYSGKTSIPYAGLPVGREIRFTNADYDMVKREIDEVEHITSRYYIGVSTNVTYKDETSSFDIRCTHPDHQYIEKSILLEGRFLNDKDIKEFRKVAVLGTLVVQQLFLEEDPIGKYIAINGINFKVVGIFEDEGGEGEQRKIYIPISTAQKIFSGKDDVDQIMFTTKDPSVDKAKQTEEQVRAMFADKHSFSPEDPRAIRVRNNIERFQQFTAIFHSIKLFVWMVGILTILAGVVGVANIMTISVKERTKEIGIRKALGASPASVVGMVLTEAVFITLVSGYIGLVVGVAMLEFNVFISLFKYLEIPVDFLRNPEVDFMTGLQAVFVLVVAGCLAGLIPAIKAANINPIVAIREE